MLTDSIKAGLATAVACLLLMLLVPTAISNFSLQHKLTLAQSDITTLHAEAMLKRFEVTGLTNAIDTQSKQITDFEQKTKAMAEARLKAQEQATRRINDLQAGIARLQQERATGCTASGIGAKILREVKQQ